ncbi:ureidoglycolate lyase [Phyllobacterium sp. SB3]|uniref:ureidoglycolate lyase n=1 Tax=Phyllobacterium sp. SB3 TaxID=3156073 RepID=UPI0032AF2565
MRHVTQPLTQSGFAGFGDVIEHRGDARRHRLSIDFDTGRDLRQEFWVSRVSTKFELPNIIAQLERHPLSDQAFVPLLGGQFLVVVCGTRQDGSPDVDNCRAFVAGPGQGIVYRRNTWHAPLSSLNAPAEFFVTMGITDNAENDEFFDLPVPLGISMEGAKT